ncbi:MAG: hypothetical protein RMJ36_04630 [Candidatus Calescibacterium sp.]|nr:hypothetical protein [Candidatus Calescibacterium sp.]MDW8132919.1 hypothetical protein [Candidatus Calescibacterium sp.]
MKTLILTIDCGSNSNKYLISLYQKKILKILNKGSFVHQLKKEENIKKYEEKMVKFIQNIKKIIKSIISDSKIDQILALAVGTEFYRDNKPSTKKITEINEECLNDIDTKFKIITQEEESYYSNKAVEFFFSNYVVLDLGGASTEITVKNEDNYKKFFYKFGCLSQTNEYKFIQDFINFYSQMKDIELILIGGSFISSLFSIRKIKNPQKFFYTLKTKQIQKFYKSIANLEDKELIEKYPPLKDRTESVKKALDFLIHLLEELKKEKVTISLATLLEGLTIHLLELNKLELSKIISENKFRKDIK